MTTRDEYVEKLKSQLDQWNAQMAQWEARTREAQAGAKAAYEQQLAQLRSQQEQAMVQMKLLQGASADAWQDLARGAESAWLSMQDAFNKARSHFEKS
jgi:hypothetical protein